MSHEPVLPIVIVPIEGGQIEESRPKSPPDVRNWQIEAFLRQTGRQTTPSAATKQSQLQRFATWCDRSWLDVMPSDIGKYR